MVPRAIDLFIVGLARYQLALHIKDRRVLNLVGQYLRRKWSLGGC
jgi:hypothetical protein